MSDLIISGGGGGASGGGIPPSICKNLTVKKNGTSVSLKWQDSGNTILDKQYLCTWAGTKIVKKLGSYPTSEIDGTVVVNNTVNNQYLTTAFVDTIPNASDDYKYAAFPYSTNGVYCYNEKNKFTEAIIYELTINPNDSNPDTRVAYPAGCTNASFTPEYMNFGNGFVYGDWELAFFQPTPVMLNYDATEAYTLYKKDFRYKADKVTLSDVSNINFAGNCMIAWEQTWIKYVMDGSLFHVYVSNKQVDSSYNCFTHYNKNGVLLDRIYTHAFQPALVNGKLRSIAGQTILTGSTGTAEIAAAQANGNAWYLMDYGEFLMQQVLFMLVTKSTNFETKIGKGRDSSNANPTTGEGLSTGMDWGTSATGFVKFMGVEFPISNYWKRLAGCVYTTVMKYKLCDYTNDGSTVIGYNTDGTGYLTHQAFSGTSGGYISAALLTANGILPTVASGSSSTYFPDGLWWAAGGYAIVGAYDNGSLDGPFALNLSSAVSDSHASIGASLSCKPL